MGLFKKFRDAWFAPMSFDSLDDDFYDRLEESLILADADTFAITTSLLVPTRIAGPQTPAPEVTIDVIDPFFRTPQAFSQRKWTTRFAGNI